MRSVVRDLALDLRGITVLTEAASGPFAVTALLAALAGAERVLALTRDSRYGTAAEVERYLREWAAELGCAEPIEISRRPAAEVAAEAELVTNLGFVRPISREVVERLPADAAVSLMWEPWEFRPEEVDLEACRQRGVPVLGTWESHPRLEIFRYVGILALKLLLESEIEIAHSRVLVLASDPFGAEIDRCLRVVGAEVRLVDPTAPQPWADAGLEAFLAEADAVVVAENRAEAPVIGEMAGLPVKWLVPALPEVVSICGMLDSDALHRLGLRVHPFAPQVPRTMTVTTGYVGPRPVIDLHAAGLKVGEALVRGMRKFQDPVRAVKFALKNSPGMDFPQPR